MRCSFDSWFGKILWRRKWKPTSVFLPGKSREQRSLAGYNQWGHRESDLTVHAHVTWAGGRVLGRVGEVGSDLASKYQIIICHFEALLDLGFKELRCLRRVSSGTDIFRIHLLLQNILASFQPWKYILSLKTMKKAVMGSAWQPCLSPAQYLSLLLMF